MRKWFAEQWKQIRGHVKFEVIKTVALFAITGGISTVIAFVLRWIQKIRHAPQQDVLGYVILGVLIFCGLILAWIVLRLEDRSSRAVPDSAKPPLVPPPLTAQQVVEKLAAPSTRPKPVDLQGRILELYIQSFENMLHISQTYVAIKVQIVNHGPDEATIVSCGLHISLGAWSLDGKILNVIPDDWRIKKQRENSFLAVAHDEIPLDPPLRAAMVYKKGHPVSGWLAFELYVYGDAEFPNAQFDLNVTDSFDGVHSITRNAGVYPRTGELIRISPAPSAFGGL